MHSLLVQMLCKQKRLANFSKQKTHLTIKMCESLSKVNISCVSVCILLGYKFVICLVVTPSICCTVTFFYALVIFLLLEIGSCENTKFIYIYFKDDLLKLTTMHMIVEGRSTLENTIMK